MEGVHLNFIKHILGVDRSANNNLCRAELGRYPISININYKIINFFRHMQNMAKDTIIHQTLIIDNSQKHLGFLGTLSQHPENIGFVYDSKIVDAPKKLIKKLLRNKYELIWKDKLKLSTQGKYFSTFKPYIRYENYLHEINNRKLRCNIVKLRLSDHKLMIENGGKADQKISRQNRLCQLCYSENLQQVEDEVHFLFDCPWRKYISLRRNFISNMTTLVANFSNMNNNQKFIFTMSNENKEVISQFSMYILLMNKEREKHSLYNK